MVQEVEYLPSKCQTLSSMPGVPSTISNVICLLLSQGRHENLFVSLSICKEKYFYGILFLHGFKGTLKSIFRPYGPKIKAKYQMPTLQRVCFSDITQYSFLFHSV
jgi:hypothetical protein